MAMRGKKKGVDDGAIRALLKRYACPLSPNSNGAEAPHTLQPRQASETAGRLTPGGRTQAEHGENAMPASQAVIREIRPTAGELQRPVSGALILNTPPSHQEKISTHHHW